jgi:uncharacterized protein involved in outer membrane biogenesis
MAFVAHDNWRQPALSVLKWLAIVLGGLLALFLILAIALEIGDWRGPVSRFISNMAGRNIVIAGPLKLHTLSFTPSAEAQDIRIDNPSWAPDKSMGQITRLTVAIKLFPLLKGDVILPVINIDGSDLSLLRTEDGKQNWSFAKVEEPKAAAEAQSKPSKIPVIRDLTIQNGKIRFEDKERHLEFAGTINSSNKTDAAGQGHFALQGDGRYARAPFHLKIEGNSLLEVKPDQPYHFAFDVQAENTAIEASGVIAHPFDLGIVDADLSVKGEDLATLYDLTGLALPNTPPYKVSGKLKRDGTLITVDDFKGTIGTSDIGGKIAIDTKGGRPNFQGDLVSDKLDFKDLGAVLGTRVSKTSAAATKPVTSKPAPGTKPDDVENKAGQVIPDAPLDVKRVRGMDANVHYRAKAVNAPGLPLREVTLAVTLDHGLLTLDPLQFTLPQGQIAGTVKIDARNDVPDTAVDLTLAKAQLQSLIHVSGDQPALEGPLQGRFQLHGAGNSVHNAAAHADGQLALAVPHGAVRQAFAELLGIDVAKGLSLLLSGNDQQTNLRCGLAHFSVQKGKVVADNVLLDTDVTKIAGSGTLDLGTEDLDFEIKGEPKHPSLRIHAPVTIKGQLGQPVIGIAPGPLLAQAGVAGALSVLTPIASIIAFIDPGLAEDADCKAILQSAKQSGAPVPKADIQKAPSGG